MDVGQLGSNADGGVFRRSSFGQAFLNGDLDIPPPKALPNAPELGILLYCIVGDETFPLRPDLMRAYPRKAKGENLPLDKAVINYCLSRARRIVENALGILSQKWRLLNCRIQLKEENVDAIKMAICCLHNFLMDVKDYTDTNTLTVDDESVAIIPEGHVLNMVHQQGYHSAKDAL